jgi:hypothetical protein
MSDAIEKLKETIRSFEGKQCVVYGGGLARPLLMVYLDGQDGSPKFDRKAYQRELMRKRRKEGKA